MGGPIVRTGTTPEFWKNWDQVFGDKKNTKRKSAPKAGKKSGKKKAAKKSKTSKARKKK
jgi:hypothetical protein